MSHLVLEGGATVLLTEALEEDLDIVSRQRLKRSGTLLDLELIEQP
jgi:hypothetical protein